MQLNFPLIYLLIVFAVFGCKKSDNVVIEPPLPPECDDPVIVDTDLYNTAPADEFQYQSAEIDGNCLKMVVRYGGGCEIVDFQLYDAAAIMESFPIQRNIRLSLEDNDNCKALVTQELMYDLTPLQVEGYSTIILNLQGYSESLTYNY